MSEDLAKYRDATFRRHYNAESLRASRLANMIELHEMIYDPKISHEEFRLYIAENMEGSEFDQNMYNKMLEEISPQE